MAQPSRSAKDAEYYKRNRERILAARRAYREANKEKINASQARYRELNRERLRAYHRSPEARLNKRKVRIAWNDDSRLRVIEHYSAGAMRCKTCGHEDLDVLTIDHINGGGRKHREQIGAYSSSIALYRWLIRHGFPSGFQILCMNCNFKKYKLEHRQRFRIDGGAAF